MSTCTVCCDKYNKTQRKKVTCPHCDYEACKTCIPPITFLPLT